MLDIRFNHNTKFHGAGFHLQPWSGADLLRRASMQAARQSALRLGRARGNQI